MFSKGRPDRLHRRVAGRTLHFDNQQSILWRVKTRPTRPSCSSCESCQRIFSARLSRVPLYVSWGGGVRKGGIGGSSLQKLTINNHQSISWWFETRRAAPCCPSCQSCQRIFSSRLWREKTSYGFTRNFTDNSLCDRNHQTGENSESGSSWTINSCPCCSSTIRAAVSSTSAAVVSIENSNSVR